MDKYCKVISYCFAPKKKRPFNNKLVFPSHSHSFTRKSDVLPLLLVNLELERSVNPGVPTDTIIVNQDISYIEGNNFLAEINGLKTKTGKIIVETRPNSGYSFGAFDHAYKKYKKHYQGWFFCEDDVLMVEDGYIKKSYDLMRENIAFVAAVSVANKHTYNPHAGGGIGYTNSYYLEQLVGRFGELPHPKSNNHKEAIDFGEIPFTNNFLQINSNYKLLEYNQERMFVFYDELYKNFKL
jgi:hypothetical protein